jgi:hypothetical protein
VAKAGSKHTAGRGSRGPLRPADFVPPERISDEKFQEACEGFGIPDKVRGKVRGWAKTYLDQLVNEVRDRMKEHLPAPYRKSLPST